MRDNKGRFIKGHAVLSEWRSISSKVNSGKVRHSTPHSKETKLKISLNRKGKYIGSKNWIWKGDSVSYRNLHRWVERYLGKPNTCEHCGKYGVAHQIQWANKSGKYLRELSDWIRLCVKCHKRYDSRKSLVLQ